MKAEPDLAIGAFATPVVAFMLHDTGELNAELTARFLEEERTQPSWTRANVGGWHSAPDLARRTDPPVRTLLQNIVEAVGHNTKVLAGEQGLEVPRYRYGVTSWAMVMREGHYVSLHDHGDAHWSIAYYADAGDDAAAPSGQLVFVDPRRGGRPIPNLDLFPTELTIRPRTGLLVVFPGWLQHYVHAYRGTRPRICVSANITMEPWSTTAS